MVDNKLEHKRKNGIYYTPKILANYLLESLLNKKRVSVFDPAYGDGALLRAAERVFNENFIKISNLDLFGCDIHPVNGLLSHLPEANLNELDFFDFPILNKYDIILTNPPYIRHQEQDKLNIKQYKKNIKELRFLSNSSDLWAYFLVKSQLHLNDNGSIGAVLPWAFLQANYAQNLRKQLIDNFESIKVLALNNPYFNMAQERVVLLWLNKYGHPTKTIKLAFASNINSKFKYKEVKKEEWISSKIVTSGKNNISKILDTLKNEYGFKEFSKYANTRIGIVTGANKYFIKNINEANQLGFKGEHLQPILTTSKELPDFLKNGTANLKKLICFKEEGSSKVMDYIKTGEDSEFHLRSHGKNRNPWYKINTGNIPDAFFPYRIGKIPYLVVNHCEIQSTNSIHRIYFKNLTKTEIKWIHITLLSIYGQLSLEINSKTYGRGMLKIEPGSLGKTLVFCSKSKNVVKTYNEIIKLIEVGEKNNAVRVATAFINKELNISNEFEQQSKEVLMIIEKTRQR